MSDDPVIQHANIYEAINAVMQECGYVQKQAASGLNYTYAGEAALIKAIRPAMVRHGVVFMPAGVADLRVETYTTSKGSVMNRVLGVFSFDFIHASSDTKHRVTVLGEGADSGDKAANKAMTGALKYALRQTLVIETGDDPDSTPSDEQERSGHIDNRHWSERADFVQAFDAWRARENITDEILLAVFGSVNYFEYPNAKTTREMIVDYLKESDTA